MAALARHPAHGTLNVIELGRPEVAAIAAKEAVRDVEGDVASRGQRPRKVGHKVPLPFHQRAAVDDDDGRVERSADRRPFDVEQQRLAADLAIDDINLALDGLRGSRWAYHRRRALASWASVGVQSPAVRTRIRRMMGTRERGTEDLPVNGLWTVAH